MYTFPHVLTGLLWRLPKLQFFCPINWLLPQFFCFVENVFTSPVAILCSGKLQSFCAKYVYLFLHTEESSLEAISLQQICSAVFPYLLGKCTDCIIDSRVHFIQQLLFYIRYSSYSLSIQFWHIQGFTLRNMGKNVCTSTLHLSPFDSLHN